MTIFIRKLKSIEDPLESLSSNSLRLPFTPDNETSYLPVITA